MHYYCCKIHTLACLRPGISPLPESIMVSLDEDTDLTSVKRSWGDSIHFLGDKESFCTEKKETRP